MEAMRKESLSFNVTKALADAYVYKGMSLEYLNTAYGNNSSSEVFISLILGLLPGFTCLILGLLPGFTCPPLGFLPVSHVYS